MATMALLLLLARTTAAQQEFVVGNEFPAQILSIEPLKKSADLQSTGTCGNASNHSTFVGKQIGNTSAMKPISVPEDDAFSVCCSIAHSYASKRSKNSTQGIGF